MVKTVARSVELEPIDRLEEKLKLADYVIDTSGTKEHTIEQVRAVYDSLRSLSV